MNWFRIDLFMIPKVIWISLSIFSNTGFRVYERIKYNSKIDKIELKDPVFILGYSRSGTTFLHYLLSKDPRFSFCATYQTLMPHIFLTLGGFTERLLQKALPKTRLMDNMRMGARMPKEEEFAMASISDASIINGFYFPKHLDKYFGRYAVFTEGEKYEREWKRKFLFFLKKASYRQPDKTLLVKSPYNTARVKQILDIFPNAKFIHIHRNPYEVYYSNEKLYESILPPLSFHKPAEGQMEKYILKSYRLTYEKYNRDISLIPNGNLVTIAYEDLVADTITVLEEIYHRFNMSGFDKAKPFINSELQEYTDYETNKHVMNPERKKNIFSEWKEFFNQFGYTEVPIPSKEPQVVPVLKS